MTKAVVLVSGGLDSATCLSLAINKYGAENVVGVSVLYGQKHAKELECANKLCDYYGISHELIDLTQTKIFDKSDCTLLAHTKKDVPEGDYKSQIDKDENGKVSTYVPFRNGLFLSAIASFATSCFPNDECEIYIGAHADDAAGNAYADCSEDFINAMNKAINIGTYKKVSIVAPFLTFSKADVVKTGIAAKTPYELTWSCYNGDDKPCGKCGTCIDRAKAFAANGIPDPALEG